MAPRKTASLPWVSRRATALLPLALGLVRRYRLRDHLDGEVRAIALAQAAQDAVLLLDDRVVAQHQRVLGADVDADVAALAEDRVPTDVGVIDPADPVLVIVGDALSEADRLSRLVACHGTAILNRRLVLTGGWGISTE